MIKILVADDEPDLEILLRQKFRKQIREKEYNFAFVANGKEAVAALINDSAIDVLLSDINMPEMDGLTLLSKQNEINPLVKSVIISAYGDMDNIRTAMNRGAFDFICKPIQFDDLDTTLNKAIVSAQHAKQTMEAIRENNILKMYVDESVINFMSRKEFETAVTANETIEATVVFIDICGFTALSERETPDNVVKLLNKYFDVIVGDILEQNGNIDKFMGDAVMAIFKGEHHLDRAVEASLNVRQNIQTIKEPIEGKPDFIPKVSIGINSGEMVSGNIGSVALRKLDYTVIGDTVNVTQRLQSAATADQILISEATYEQVKDAFRCQKVGEITLKNKALPMIVYEVLD